MTSAASQNKASTPVWDPQQYEQFGTERARPFNDLMAHVDAPGARRVADLGCGTGSLTADLLTTWPAARVVGVDSSPEMMEQAARRQIPGRLEFELGDLRHWEPDEPLDVLVSNATLQWVPDHLAVLERLASLLAPGGVLAIQVPGNFGEPTHRLLADLVSEPRWTRAVGEVAWPASHEPSEYLGVLLAAGLQASVWETTYSQVLRGSDAVLECRVPTVPRPWGPWMGSPNPPPRSLP